MYQSPFLTPLIGVPSWPHAAPLLAGLHERGDLRLATMDLEAIAEALRVQTCACALVPPAMLLDNPDLCVIPGAGLVAGIGCATERLITPYPLETIRVIQVAPEARPLSVYVQCIFAARGLPIPSLVPSDQGKDGDALLISGAGDQGSTGAGHDVTELWHATTDTPLVLGVWACHATGPLRLLRTVLGEAARRGTAEFNETGSGACAYHLLSAESEGLRVLHRLAKQHAIAGASVESIAFC